jgi:hypothetical protein
MAVTAMRLVSSLIVILVAATLVACLALPTSARAADAEVDVTYEELDDVVEMQAGNVTVIVSKTMPAAMINTVDRADEPAYGIVISAVLGYNATEDGMLVLEEVPYHASLEHATWSLAQPSGVSEDARGEVAEVTLQSSVSMNRRIAFDGGNPAPGDPGIEIIDDWATVKITFTLTSGEYESSYEPTLDAPDYHVNGTSELKFDISMDINEPIMATDLALDIGIMMMDNGTFEPTSMPQPYLFEGYQEDLVSESDPSVNETDENVQIVHPFKHRSDFKQLFTLLEGGDSEEAEEMAFFGWARQAEFSYIDLEDELVDLATLYRTDGESLRVYLSTPINETVTYILHDPSIGVFQDVGYIDLPDQLVSIGASGFSIIVGVVIGLAAVGGTSAILVTRNRSTEQDPAEIVVLEKNRYYRKGR